MIVKKAHITFILLLPIFFWYGYSLISAYTEGDQRGYRSMYEALADAEPLEVMVIANAYVAVSEPISAYVLWAGAILGIDKDFYIALLNVLLLVGIFLLGKRYSVGVIPLFLLLTNFYVIVLMTGAERLKIAYLLLIWAVLWGGKKEIVLVGISPLAHLQNFILFPSLLLANAADSIKRLVLSARIKKRFIITTGIVLVCSAVIFAFLYEDISGKASSYLSQDINLFVEIVKLVVLSAIAFVATKDRWRMALALIPMYPVIYLIGGQRANMIAVTLALFFLMKERVLNHPLVMALLIYFSLKSIPFVQKIFIYGNGFVSL